MSKLLLFAGLLLAPAVLARAADDDPDYRAGVALFEKGKLQEAIAPLERAVAHPEDAQAWKALGVVHAAAGDYELAEPPFANACRLDPRLPDACYFLGRARYALDRFEASLDALAHAPPSGKVRLAIAQSLEALDRPVEAERSFQQAMGLIRDDSAVVAYGTFLVRAGRASDAVALLRPALERFPHSSGLELQLGRALLALNRTDEAIPHLERAVGLNGASAQAHLVLGRAYLLAGRAAEAQPHLERGSAAK